MDKEIYQQIKFITDATERDEKFKSRKSCDFLPVNRNNLRM